MKFKSLTSILAGAFTFGSVVFSPSKAVETTQIKVETPIEQTIGGEGYFTTNIINADNSIETRASYNGHHFMSVIEKDKCIAMRFAPGPGTDRWGTSIYPQPFLPGATIKGLTLKNIFPLPFTSDGLRVRLEGTVSRGASETFGNYWFEVDFQDYPSENRVEGRGYYGVTLKDKLSTVNADLNVIKIASNYLDDVPLLDGTTGDTGDTDKIQVQSWDNQGHIISKFTWDPVLKPSHFPQDFSENLTLLLPGKYNNIDTVRQGYAPIKAAFKPGFGITLERRYGGQMIFGGMYNTSQSKQFWSDNIGVTPLVVKSDAATNLLFELMFNCYAANGANNEDEVTLTATGNSKAYAGAYYARNLQGSFVRIGSLPLQNGVYRGLLKIPAPWNDKDKGFFRVEEEY